MSAMIGSPPRGSPARGDATHRRVPTHRSDHPSPNPRRSIADAGRSHGPAGLEARVRRLGPGRGVGADRRAGPGRRTPRLRVDLGLRPLPHGPAAGRGDDPRVVLDDHRPGDGDRAGPARPHGGLHRLPQPRPDREALVDDRCHLRRPLRARHRRRLEGGRVAGLRLRVPAAGRTARRPRRPPPDHPGDVRARASDLRGPVRPREPGDQRTEGSPEAAHPDHRRRQRTRT